MATVFLAVLASMMQAKTAIAVMMTLTAIALLGGLYSCAVALSDARWSLRHRSQILLILTPLAICIFLTVAFWGFLISSAICFYVTGELLRWGSRPALHRQVRMAAMLVLAYWAHPLPVTLSGAFLVCLLVVEQWQKSSQPIRTWKTTLTEIAEATWPWLIPAALCVWSMARLVALTAAPKEHFSMKAALWSRLLDFLRMGGLIEVSPSPTSGSAFVLLLGVLITAAVLKPKSENRRERAISIFTLALIAVYFFVPESVGGGSWIPNRILFYAAAFVTILALSPGRLEGRQTWLCCFLATICILFFAGEYLLVSRRLAQPVQELRLALADVPRNSRVILLTYRLTPDCARWPLEERAKPERHLAVFPAAERELIILNDYEPTTSQFPVLYRDASFVPLVSEILFVKGDQDRFIDGLKKTSAIDYVISWGVASGVHNCSAWIDAPLQPSLMENYNLLARRTGISRVEIWNVKAEPLIRSHP
jgi:hypothetical protein